MSVRSINMICTEEAEAAVQANREKIKRRETKNNLTGEIMFG